MTPRASTLVRWCLAGCAALLGGCAHYEPKPLDKIPDLAASSSALAGASGRPITIRELDRLVLLNNPDLRAARLRVGIGNAQVIQAGVLPNPQLNAAYPFLVGGPGGTSDGYTLALAQDLKSLILRPTRREAAINTAAEIHAGVLWQEWVTIGRARLVFVDLVSGERAQKLLMRNRKFLQERYDLTQASIRQGSATLATLSPDLVALGDVQRAADDLERLQQTRRQQLNALLGLKPDAVVPLAPDTAIPRLDAASIRGGLATLSDRRPDLIALQYGYRAQDARLRLAILTQYPSVIVGVAGGRDTQSIYAVGPQVTMDLPVFDRNQGGIAIESATREVMNAEFKARLTAATGEIVALLSQQTLLSQQLVRVAERVKEARALAEKTEEAYRNASFDERAYVDIQVARLAREQEEIGLRQALLEGQVALATLIGAGMPRISIPPEPPPTNPLGLLAAAAPGP